MSDETITITDDETQASGDTGAPTPTPTTGQTTTPLTVDVEALASDGTPTEAAADDATPTTSPTKAADTIDAGTWLAIQRARSREREAESDVDEAKEALKAAKERADEASVYLGKLIDEAHQPTLFNGEKAADAGVGTAADAMRDGLTAAADNETWKLVPLAELTPAIKPAKLALLAEHEPRIATVGQLADFTAAKGEWWWKDVKGLGEGGAQQIGDALEQFYADREKAKQAAAASAPPPAGAELWADIHNGEKEPHTAQDGDPSSASRGAAVGRAKLALATVIEKKLDAEPGALPEISVVAVIGRLAGKGTLPEAYDALETATLADVESWTEGANAMPVDTMLKAIEQHAPVTTPADGEPAKARNAKKREAATVGGVA